MNKKSGISMFILILTVAVMLIILTTISIRMADISDISEISIFANNVNSIEDYIASCNILKEEAPFCGEIMIDDIKKNMTTEYLEKFLVELENRGDSQTVSFKKIDLGRIVTDNNSTGFEKNGVNDIYVYSEITDTVYYLRGIKYNEDIYFCINEKITNIIK